MVYVTLHEMITKEEYWLEQSLFLIQHDIHITHLEKSPVKRLKSFDAQPKSKSPAKREKFGKQKPKKQRPRSTTPALDKDANFLLPTVSSKNKK